MMEMISFQVFAFAVLIHQSVWLVSGMNQENKETKVFKNGDAVN